MLFVLLTIILYSIISNFLIGGLISVVNYNSYKLAFADDSNTSESSDNKDTGYAGNNKDNVITKEASKDQKEHSSNSDQNTENSTEIGKPQVDVKLEQPVHGGEKQKITVKVTNSSLDPIKGAKVTGTVKILSHKMELSEKTSNSGKVHFSIEIGAQSEPSVAKISLKTSAKGYDSESSKVFFNILPDKTEQEGKDKEQKVSSTDTKHDTKENTNGQQESNTDRNEKSITISTDSSTMNSNQDSCDEGESKKRNDNQEQCDPQVILSDVIINSVNDGNGKKLSNNETTTADNLELTFSDHGNSSVNTFDCSLDGKSAEECTSPYVIENISLGSHRFQVRGIEDDQGASYDTYSWIRKEKVELESALESSIQSPSLTQLVTAEGNGPVNPNPPNNISKSQPQNMPLFSILALDTAGPAVTSTNPINGTTEVPLDKVITATFNGTCTEFYGKCIS